MFNPFVCSWTKHKTVSKSVKQVAQPAFFLRLAELAGQSTDPKHKAALEKLAATVRTARLFSFFFFATLSRESIVLRGGGQPDLFQETNFKGRQGRVDSWHGYLEGMITRSIRGTWVIGKGHTRGNRGTPVFG